MTPMNHSRLRTSVAIVALAGALGAFGPTTGHVQAQAKAVQPIDGGWPRASVTASGAHLIVYQPQIASWVNQANVVLYTAISYTPAGAQKASLGTVKAEATTSVAVDQRLVSFSEFHITETNFTTLDRDQLQAGGRGSHHRSAADRAGDRARSRARQRQREPDHSEERRRRESRSAADLLQHDDGDPGESRRRSDLEPDSGQRSQVCGQHQLGSVRVHPDADVLPARHRQLAERDGVKGPWTHAGRCPTASRSCRTLPTGKT